MVHRAALTAGIAWTLFVAFMGVVLDVAILGVGITLTEGVD